ncbi:MAG: Serine/threonine-protein kinase PrkC [Planctomycetota bacterium]
MKFTFAPESRPLSGYVIKRAIHRGGFGEVYFAISDAGRHVALKLLNHNMEVELRGVKQCLNLNHPNLVTIFDIRQDSDRDHWIVMEYVGGSSLQEVLQRYPAGMPVDQIVQWLTGISAGLAFLHDRGLVHRDLKPANVLSDGEQVKIADVGLSKYISESRRSAQTQSVGTVYYMAPEVCRGRYGREVDVYAVSVMLVEMMTGRLPFDGETTAEILMKHLTSEPDLSGLDPAVQQVLRAGLEKDPNRRIQDILELQRRFCLALQAAGSVVAGESPAVGKAMVTPGMAQGAPRVKAELVDGALEVRARGEPRAVAGGAAVAVEGARRPAMLATTVPGQALDGGAAARGAAGGFQRVLPVSDRWRDALVSSVTAFPSALVVTATLYFLTDLVPTLAEAVLFFVATLLSVWVLLVPAKLWQGTIGDQLFRRTVQGVAGVAVGLTIWWLRQFLLLSNSAVFMTDQTGFAAPRLNEYVPLLSGRFPTCAGFITFFFVLFAVRQWWLQGDRLRLKRLRVTSALMSAVSGTVAGVFVPFPLYLAITLALSISLVLQLSASWVPQNVRSVSMRRG